MTEFMLKYPVLHTYHKEVHYIILLWVKFLSVQHMKDAKPVEKAFMAGDWQ